MAGDLHALLDHRIIYKLVELRLPSEEDFLDHMVSIDVLCKLPHLIFEERGE